MRQPLSFSFGSANSLAPARDQLYRELGRQASLWAFADVFRWLSFLCFLCVAVVWFFRGVRPSHSPEGAH